MVVDFLKSRKREGPRVWVLALLFCSSMSALAGSSRALAQLSNLVPTLSGHVSEEDLPPEEPHAPAPLPGAVSPLPSPSSPGQKLEGTAPVPSVAKEPTVATPAAPVLPAHTAPSPQELVDKMIALHGVKLEVLMKMLKNLTMESSGDLVDYIECADWLIHADPHSRITILGYIDYAIIRLRIRHGLPPFDDALPGEEDTAFQVIRKILTGV